MSVSKVINSSIENPHDGSIDFAQDERRFDVADVSPASDRRKSFWSFESALNANG
jgi:hypothetical protein